MPVAGEHQANAPNSTHKVTVNYSIYKDNKAHTLLRIYTNTPKKR